MRNRKENKSAMVSSAIACGMLAATFTACSSGVDTDRASYAPSNPMSSSSAAMPLSSAETATVKPEPMLASSTPDPVQARAAWREGVALFEAGDYPGASTRFGIAATGRPEDSYGHYLLGLSLWKSGQLERAEEALSRALTLDQNSLNCRINLARVRMDRDDPRGALEAIDSALAIDPLSGNALHQRGRALAALGRDEEALSVLKEARDRSPENGYIANTLGYLLLRKGRLDEALPLLETAREKLPRTAYVRNNLGVGYERTGQIEKASLEFQAAVDAGDSGGKAAASLTRLEPLIRDLAARKPQVVTPDAAAVAKSQGPDDPDPK